jgi:hypothetical protein
MRTLETVLLHAIAACSVALALVACGKSQTTNNGDPCAENYAHRESHYLVIPLDAGDASLDAARDEDVVVLGADASPACEGPCMAMARAESLEDPKFTSCSQSSLVIACTIDVQQPLPCDLVNP